MRHHASPAHHSIAADRKSRLLPPLLCRTTRRSLGTSSSQYKPTVVYVHYGILSAIPGTDQQTARLVCSPLLAGGWLSSITNPSRGSHFAARLLRRTAFACWQRRSISTFVCPLTTAPAILRKLLTHTTRQIKDTTSTASILGRQMPSYY
ncbi:hypothetical protein LZ31DRAFT_6480 [Colletotrichum somersetense]|nr:hypothetical protein LZ31DRAFT_6480 [Colletotrichum somersetense]